MKYLSFILVWILSACDPYDMRLTIVNNSRDTIFFEISENGYFNTFPIWIDSTSLDTLWTHTDFVVPDDRMNIASMGRNSWEKRINESYKDSTLIVFIFDQKLLRSITPDSLMKNQLYSQKFSYKVEDLEKQNWEVVYDGRE